MAVSYVGSSFTEDDSDTTTTTISFAVSGSNTLLLVYVAIDCNPGVRLVNGITYNGVAMTAVESATTGDSILRTELWRLIAPADGTHDVVVTYNNTGARDRRIIVAQYAGVDQTTPLDANTSESDGTDNVTAITLTYTNGAVGDLIADFAAMRQTSGSFSADSPLAARHAAGTTVVYAGLAERTGSTSVVCGWTVTGNNGANRQSVVGINPAAGGATAVPVFMNQYRQRWS